MTEEKVLSMSATREITSLGRTSIYDGIRKGTFPKPIKLGVRRVGFLSSEIWAFIAARASERAVA
jgi:prophage regulatory protein